MHQRRHHLSPEVVEADVAGAVADLLAVNKVRTPSNEAFYSYNHSMRSDLLLGI